MLGLLNVSPMKSLFYALLFLAILFLILLITRELWCWFFKTSEIARLLEEISEKISANHNFQVEVAENEYKWRKAEWEQKYGDTAEKNLE